MHWLGWGFAGVSVSGSLAFVLVVWCSVGKRAVLGGRYDWLWYGTWYDSPFAMFMRGTRLWNLPLLLLASGLVLACACIRVGLLFRHSRDAMAQWRTGMDVAQFCALQLLLSDLMLRLLVSFHFSWCIRSGGPIGPFPFDAVFGNAVVAVPAVALMLVTRIGLGRRGGPELPGVSLLAQVTLITIAASVAAVHLCLLVEFQCGERLETPRDVGCEKGLGCAGLGTP